MGAWGSGSFENDDALDWIGDLAQAKDWKLVERSFAAVVADDIEYAEAPDCCAAIAAAEVVAAAYGRANAGLPREARVWVAARGKPHPGLARVATEALEVLLEDSELRELWEESELEQWQNAVEELKSRLQAA